MSDALTPIDRLIIRRDQQRRKGAHAEAAQSNREIGLLLAEAGEYERGLAYLAEALDAFPAKSYDAAVCDHSIGLVLAELDRTRESVHALARARAIYGELHRFLAVADCDEHLGNGMLALGRPLDAMVHFEAARRIYFEITTSERVQACDEGIDAAKLALHPREPERGRPRRAQMAPRIAAA